MGLGMWLVEVEGFGSGGEDDGATVFAGKDDHALVVGIGEFGVEVPFEDADEGG